MSAQAGNVTIRAATAADAAAIARLVAEAFGRDEESRLVAALTESSDAVGSFVAEHAGAVIGHVLFSRLDAPFRALALAPLSVLPAHQNRGIGSELIRYGLDWAANENWDAVIVLGEPEYYGRFGFSVDAAQGYECAYSGPYLMARFFGNAPTPPGRIGYPAPFAALG